MKIRKKRKEKYILIDKNFLNSVEILYKIERLYKKRQFNEALELISRYINYINIPSLEQLSIFFDIVASILWKIGENNKAYDCWKKSYDINNNNRHSRLSLDFLCNNEIKKRYLCEMFINLKMNEFIAKKGYYSENEKNEFIIFLYDYWYKNLSNKDLTQFDEIEVADYFIGLNIFEN